MKDQYPNEVAGDEESVTSVYKQLLESWNKHDAVAYAGFFSEEANVVGFDGSQLNGRKDIYQQISEIFKHHKVAAYTSVVQELRALGPGIYLLRAVAGMVPPGGKDINPALNAIQTMIAVKQQEIFKITFFQNTPAAFHGRPELVAQLTAELQKEHDRT